MIYSIESIGRSAFDTSLEIGGFVAFMENGKRICGTVVDIVFCSNAPDYLVVRSHFHRHEVEWKDIVL